MRAIFISMKAHPRSTRREIRMRDARLRRFETAHQYAKFPARRLEDEINKIAAEILAFIASSGATTRDVSRTRARTAAVPYRRRAARLSICVCGHAQPPRGARTSMSDEEKERARDGSRETPSALHARRVKTTL